ncbi:MAG: PAS domain S-box protein [Candidatus Kapaibacterium sp.]
MKNLIEIIKARLIPPVTYSRGEGMNYIREKLLQSVFILMLTLGLLPTIFSIYLAFRENLYIVGIGDIFFYLLFVFVFMSKKVSLNVKSFTLTSIAYLVGIMLIWFLGPNSAGLIWLMSFAIFAGMLFGFNGAFWGLGINTLTIFVSYYLMNNNLTSWDVTFFRADDNWIAMSFNFIFLNALISIGLASILKALARKIEHEKEISDQLIIERQSLSELNKKLNEKIIENEIVEQELYRNRDVLQKAQEFANVGSWEVDLKKSVVKGSDQARKIYGIESLPDEIPFEIIKNVALPEYRTKLDAALEGLIKNDEKYDIIFAIKRYNTSELVYIRSIADKELDQNGNLISIIGTIQDITEQKLYEQKLHESFNQYRILFDNANDAIFIMRNDTFIDCNIKTLKMFACERKDIVGRSPYLFSPELQPDGLSSKDKANELINKALTSGPQFFEWTHQKLDGTNFSAEVSLNQIEISDRIYLQAIVRDITERKRSEKVQQLMFNIANATNFSDSLENLFLSIRDHLSILLDTSNFFIALYEKETDYITLPYFVDEKDSFQSFPAGNTLTSHVIKNNVPVWKTKPELQLMVEKGEIDNFGSMCEVWMGVPLRKGNDVIGALVIQNYENPNSLTFEDFELLNYISDQIAIAVDRRHTEDVIAKNEERLKLALEATSDGLWDWHVAKNWIYYSPRYYEMLGYNELELDNSFEAFAESVHPDDFEQIDRQIRNLVDSGVNNFEAEFRQKKKSGEYIWVLSQGRIVRRDEDGNPARIIGTHSDITERKETLERINKMNVELEQRVKERTRQLENALQELQFENEERKATEIELQEARDEISKALEKERELSELKTRFVSMVSHEYRTPLTIILSSTYLLEILYEQRKAADFSRNIKKIQNSVQDMTQLLEEVLILGKSELKDINPTLKSISMEKLIKDTIDETNSMDYKSHNYTYVLDPLNQIIKTDAKILRHILRNLLSNASKYSPDESEISIRSEIIDGHLRVTVSDQGIGIPKEDLNMLFEPFHRSSNVGTIKGTGLGLAIVKRYANALNAEIKIKTRLNEGTDFSLIFPSDIIINNTNNDNFPIS